MLLTLNPYKTKDLQGPVTIVGETIDSRAYGETLVLSLPRLTQEWNIGTDGPSKERSSVPYTCKPIQPCVN